MGERDWMRAAKGELLDPDVRALATMLFVTHMAVAMVSIPRTTPQSHGLDGLVVCKPHIPRHLLHSTARLGWLRRSYRRGRISGRIAGHITA